MDGLLVLAVCKYVDMWQKTQERTPIMDAILLLEHALTTNSTHNFHYKLLLVRLYCHPLIGAIQRAIDLWKGMDVKQILVSESKRLVMG